jgi:hypothetical protein
LVIGALVAGCSDDESPRGGATPKEPEPAGTTEPAKDPAAPRRSSDLRDQGRDIAWLKRLHRWELNLSDDAVRVETVDRIVQRGGRGEDALRKPLVQLTRCEKNLLRQVGEPAAARYRPGYDLLAEACGTLKGLSLKMIHSLNGDSGAGSSSGAGQPASKRQCAPTALCRWLAGAVRRARSSPG